MLLLFSPQKIWELGAKKFFSFSTQKNIKNTSSPGSPAVFQRCDETVHRLKHRFTPCRNHEVMEQIDVRILSWDGPESKNRRLMRGVWPDSSVLVGFFSVFFFLGGGVANSKRHTHTQRKSEKCVQRLKVFTCWP